MQSVHSFNALVFYWLCSHISQMSVSLISQMSQYWTQTAIMSLSHVTFMLVSQVSQLIGSQNSGQYLTQTAIMSLIQMTLVRQISQILYLSGSTA